MLIRLMMMLVFVGVILCRGISRLLSCFFVGFLWYNLHWLDNSQLRSGSSSLDGSRSRSVDDGRANFSPGLVHGFPPRTRGWLTWGSSQLAIGRVIVTVKTVRGTPQLALALGRRRASCCLPLGAAQLMRGSFRWTLRQRRNAVRHGPDRTVPTKHHLGTKIELSCWLRIYNTNLR